MGIKLTETAKGLVEQTAQQLRAQFDDETGAIATESAAIEYLIRKATNAPMDFRPPKEEPNEPRRPKG